MSELLELTTARQMPQAAAVDGNLDRRLLHG